MKKKLEIGLVAVLCLLLWATEMMTGWFSAHFPSWFFQTVWGVTLGRLCHHSSWPDLVERRVS